jgi:hypothetical protein
LTDQTTRSLQYCLEIKRPDKKFWWTYCHFFIFLLFFSGFNLSAFVFLIFIFHFHS